MRILFDQGTPVPLRGLLGDNQVETVFERGWSNLANGQLLNEAARAGFQILITTDNNLRHQQNLAGRSIAIVVLSTTSWPRIQRAVAAITQVIETATPGSVQEVNIPR